MCLVVFIQLLREWKMWWLKFSKFEDNFILFEMNVKIWTFYKTHHRLIRIKILWMSNNSNSNSLNVFFCRVENRANR